MEASIEPYRESFREQLIGVWESSARATHYFVSAEDFEYYKSAVERIDFSSFTVHCLIKEGMVIGFIGTENNAIASLFLDPKYIGKGYGTQLMRFALSELNTNEVEVEVNEQNTEAVKFYSKFGFTAYARTEKDSEGKDYPILKMRLSVTSDHA